jgi:hypothetical protein
LARQRVGHVAADVAEVAPADRVLGEAQRHADGGRGEAVVEAGLLLQQAGEQRPEQGADVDAEVAWLMPRPPRSAA